MPFGTVWRGATQRLSVLLICGVPLFGAAADLTNTSNPAISPDFVAGDNFHLNIGDATVGGIVTVDIIANGVDLGTFYEGTVDTSGNYDMYGSETNAQVGTYQEQWYVNGDPVFPTFEIQVLPQPSSLSVSSYGIYKSDCGENESYGILITVTDQILGPSGQSVVISGSGFSMQGNATYYIYNQDGSLASSGTENVGATNNATGRMIIEPIGLCYSYVYYGWTWATWSIRIVIGNSSYLVRPGETWTSDGTRPNGGDIYNNYGDVYVSQ